MRLIRVALYGWPLVIAAHGPDAIAQAANVQHGEPQAHTLDAIDVVRAREAYQVQRTTTATKTDTPLRDVPQSITVVTEGLIKDQAMQSMADVVRYVPGVQMAQGEGHRDAPILRGNTSTADFFINGVRDDVQYYRDLYNVERVEVLKGPSGMVFGRGGAGGLINRVTKQADWSGTKELGLTVGSWNNRRLTGDYDHVLSDVAAARVTALYEDSDSYRDHAHVRRWALNPTFSVRATDTTSLTFGYEHFEDDRVTDRGIPSLLPIQGKPLPIDASTFFGSPDLSPAWARINALTALVTHEFAGGAKLTNQTRYADYDKFYQNVFPGAYAAATNRVAISAYDNLTTRKNLLNQTDLTFSAETGDISHQFLIGMELNRQETENLRKTGYFTDIGANATSAFVTLPTTIYTGPVLFRQSATDASNHSVARTAAVYAQDQIEFSPQWQAIVGLRYDRFDAELVNRRTGTTLESTDDLLSPRAGLIYTPRENLSVYASYTIAHVPRAGEQLASLTASNRNLDPEKFVNREVGLKWDVSERLSATAAIYRLQRSNVAITDPNNPAQSLLVDGQRVQGLEMGLSGHLTEAWQLMAGYAYQDSEVQTPDATNGNALGQVPKHSASLWNRYDFNTNWGAGLGVVYRDAVYVASDNAVVLPGFARVDAAVFYSLSPTARLQLNVENLFDRGYYASAHSNNNIMPGSPRAVRLGLNLKF
ncbi:TonB-dependent siderophore receptor [Xanthomonas hydrangeae]|uniref:TonB-dependent receptor n=1 Tax=Xanthomonas hydrangeae TaxID=2775159 RepID=UPI001E62851D